MRRQAGARGASAGIWAAGRGGGTVVRPEPPGIGRADEPAGPARIDDHDRELG
jgi:hypothetical protein